MWRRFSLDQERIHGFWVTYRESSQLRNSNFRVGKKTANATAATAAHARAHRAVGTGAIVSGGRPEAPVAACSRLGPTQNRPGKREGQHEVDDAGNRYEDAADEKEGHHVAGSDPEPAHVGLNEGSSQETDVRQDGPDEPNQKRHRFQEEDTHMGSVGNDEHGGQDHVVPGPELLPPQKEGLQVHFHGHSLRSLPRSTLPRCVRGSASTKTTSRGCL